jgi:hypothetical protein
MLSNEMPESAANGKFLISRGVSAGAISVSGCPSDAEIRYPSPVDPVFG